MEIIVKKGKEKRIIELPDNLDIDYIVEAICEYAERENWDGHG